MKEEERVNIESLDLSMRSLNGLRAIEITYIDQLEEKTALDLLNYRNIGLKSVREIRKELARHGKCLKNEFMSSSEQEKKLIQSLPNLIFEMQRKLCDLERSVKFLGNTLDLLHLEMSPKTSERFKRI